MNIFQLPKGSFENSITIGSDSYPYFAFASNGSVLYTDSYYQSTMFAVSTATHSLL
ncbi:MAG: hypothetical protein ACP5OR_05645 [Candidatus Dormibacteria bacterium]